MANIAKTKSGTWRARVTYRQNGQRKWITKTFDSKREANIWATDTENKRNNNGLRHLTKETLIEYMHSWFQTFKEPRVSAVTSRRYESTFSSLEDYWGTRELNSITVEDYQKYINFLAKDHAVSTVRKLHSQTRTAIKKAYQLKKIDTDFTDGIEISGLEVKSEKLKYLEAHDMRKLLEFTCNHILDISNVAYIMIATGLLTGMRYEEVVGLTWDNVDLDNNIIYVRRAYNTLDRQFLPTKNKSSIRDINIPEKLSALLSNWHTIIETFCRENNVVNRHDFVFLSATGGVMTNETVNHTLKRVLKQLGVSKIITFHGLRHTHASYLLAKGISLQYVSKRLGHRNTVITQETYAHLLEVKKIEEDQKAISQLSKL